MFPDWDRPVSGLVLPLFHLSPEFLDHDVILSGHLIAVAEHQQDLRSILYARHCERGSLYLTGYHVTN
jgi:hypothetical protein